MAPVRDRRRLGAAFATAALGTGAFAAWLAFGPGGDTVTLYVDDLGTVVAAAAATVLSARAGLRHCAELRRFWWLLAAACAAWTLGEAIWGVYDLVLKRDVPIPSWADLGYLTAIPLAAAALFSHPAMRGTGTRRARSAFDGLIVATSLLFLSWTIVLGPLWRMGDETTAADAVALAYPFGDVVIGFLVVLVARRMPREGRLALWCLLAGLLCMALADSTYAYLTGVAGYQPGALLDAGWVAAYSAIALGAYCSRGIAAPARSAKRAGPALAPVVAGFVPMLAALGVLAVSTTLGHPPDGTGFVLAFVLVGLALARQALVLIELAGPAGDRSVSWVGRLNAALVDDPEPSR